MEKIIIRAFTRPASDKPEEMIKWFCAVFGFSNDPEEDTIEEEILEKFADAALHNRGIASSELKLKEDLARSTIIYHLNRFIDSGLIVKRGRIYYLRAGDMSTAIEEIEYDLNREMAKMLDAAKEFDRVMQKRMKHAKER